MLESIGDPGFYSLTQEKDIAFSWVQGARSELQQSTGVFVFEGRRMTTIDKLLREFAAVLHFPPYFGHNFNALEDCLTDLSWTGVSAYVLVVLDACSLLTDESDGDLQALLELLGDVRGEWSNPVRGQGAWDRAARPFHVILQATARDWESCRHRFVLAGAELTPLEL